MSKNKEFALCPPAIAFKSLAQRRRIHASISQARRTNNVLSYDSVLYLQAEYLFQAIFLQLPQGKTYLIFYGGAGSSGYSISQIGTHLFGIYVTSHSQNGATTNYSGSIHCLGPTIIVSSISARIQIPMTAPSPALNLALGLRADPGSVPLIIGVIGHRDPLPSEIPKIAKHFERLLEQIRNACPSTPIWMLNGLAEGMDSIAAEVFLQRAGLDGGRRMQPIKYNNPDKLISVLPKDRADYFNDFDSKASKERLQKLLDSSDAIIEPANNHELRNRLGTTLEGPECYALQGDFVAKYAYLLFAFFDGIDTGLVGGTAHTLAIHQGEIHPLFRSTEEILRSREEGKAIIIHTPRTSTVLNQSSAKDSLGHEEQLSTDALETCNYIDTINKTICDPSFRATQYDEIEGALTKLLSYSDTVAGLNKKRYEKIAVALVFIGFVLVATVDFYKDAQALGWGLVFVAFAIFPTIQKKLQKPFLTYRCLAESLTIQYIWSANGIITSTADLLFSHNQDDIGRIRVLLRTVALQLMLARENDQETTETTIVKSRIWIRGQINFLSRRIKRFKRLATRWKVIAYMFAGAGIATASIQLLPIDVHTPENLVNVFLAGFASSLAYQELMGYEQTFERYDISLRAFERAFAALSYLDDAKSQYWEESVDSHYRFKLILDAIGKEKINELNEWMSNQLENSYQPA